MQAYTHSLAGYGFLRPTGNDRSTFTIGGFYEESKLAACFYFFEYAKKIYLFRFDFLHNKWIKVCD